MHAEVETLRQRLGISYKDACHRLYYQHQEAVKNIEKNAKAWRDMEMSLNDSLDYMWNYEQLLEAARISTATEIPDKKMPTHDKGKGRETNV